MNNSNGVNWADAVWQEINEAVVKEMAKVRIAQKVFPTTALDTNPQWVANEVIDFASMSIEEGSNKPFMRITQEFSLTSTQMEKEPEIKTCKTLARMAAKAIALGEDVVIFQGNNAQLPANVATDPDPKKTPIAGLLVQANPNNADDNDANKVSKPIDVQKPANPRPGVLFGENVFSAVADGIAKLTNKAQAASYALFLPIKVYADTFVPPSDASLVTTAERIRPLVEGGFYGSGTLPADKGLLVALAGDPTTLYVGQEATTEYVRKEGSRYFFQVVERVQFVARDPRAFVLLNFQ